MTDRGMWGSRLGFILAAAGSAVGLGNIWGFPTQVGRGGGAAFVVVYLLCVVVICAPILIAEVALGRTSRQAPVGAFLHVRPGSPWGAAGALAVLTCVCIMSFYVVIGGWTLAYIWYSAIGAIPPGPEAAAARFTDLTASGVAGVLYTLAFVALTMASNIGGIRAGIERVSKVLMPALMVLLVVLTGRALTLPGASQGLAYYLAPDLSKVFDANVLAAALGQAFFSLSLGMGIMITYGSYLDRSESIGRSVLWVVALDTLIALLAGLIVFPAGFSIAGFDPSASGPGLIFNVLPQLFATMPGGQLFGAAFFILLALAALTSSISLLEVPASHLIDRRGWSRPTAVIVASLVVFALAIPSALGNGAVDALTNFVPPSLGGNFLGFMATVWNNFSLPIGGLLVALFAGYAWGVPRALDELLAERAWFPMPGVWGVLIRFVAPVAIASIIVSAVLALM